MAFQSTRPRGARRTPSAKIDAVFPAFQSTRPRGARRHIIRQIREVRVVSIHAPARGATTFFYSQGQCFEVSIHAPARGATRTHDSGHALQEVSIHAPARGATRRRLFLSDGSRFQSTRPRGARQSGLQDTSSYTVVSIHAPARGATLTAFNKGGHVSFQSTRPRGARRAGVCGFRRQSLCFNPRAREGRDFEILYSRPQGQDVSIHAPARGATTLQSRGIA